MNPMNPGFADLGSQIEYVKQSLGMGDPSKNTFKEGNGWDRQYELYCVRCNVEILKPFIDEKDPKRLKRCPKCKELNELWSRDERRKQLQQHMDDLEQDEKDMKSRKKRWKKYRKKFPLKQYLKDLQITTDDDEKGLKYKEHEMWIAKVDFDEYLDNEFYIPRSIKQVTDRAWDLHAKYQICKKQMDIAIQQKQRGNDALKAGKYQQAIKHYASSICARTDYKASYNNRALALIKLKRYDECIAHCTAVINQVKFVDIELEKDDVNFKAYLRRANGYKMKEDYDGAKRDLEVAQSIKPNDGSCKKLLSECKVLHRRVKLRRKLQRSCDSDVNLNDFESVFNLSIEFLEEATSIESGNEWQFETGHSEELLRRLLIFLAKEKKFCVRFADNNGVELSLKYLRCKFKIIKKWKEKLPSLEKPFLLLNYCCEKDVNFNELKNRKLHKLIGIVVLYSYGYFGEMHKELQCIAMRFVAVVCSIDDIREYISGKHGDKLLGYFLKFQKKTNPEKQQAKAIRCLFESLQYLCTTETFQKLLLKHKNPYLYEVFFHSMIKYTESKAIKERNVDNRKQMMEYEQLQFAISVCLDGCGLLFDGGRSPDKELEMQSEEKQQESDCKREEIKSEMVMHFINNKNIDKYMELLRDYLGGVYRRFKEYDIENKKSEMNKKECMRYFGQMGKCIQVFVALSRSDKAHSMLFKHSIHSELISLIGVCRNPCRHRYDGMKAMLKVTKNNILVYFDQLSNDERFDDLLSNAFDSDESNECATKLPYFWSFICDVFIEEYKERPHPQLMQQFAHFKSCAIRLVYRWCCRRVDDTKGNTKKVSYILQLMIKKYFAEFLEWLTYNDLQVLANTPLVIRQLIIYSCNMSKEKGNSNNKKYIKKMLSIKILKIIMRLMKAPHQVIQYNACLLMATINEIDAEMAITLETMGVHAMLEGFHRVQQQRQEQMQMQSQNPAIAYK